MEKFENKLYGTKDKGEDTKAEDAVISYLITIYFLV